MPVKPEVLAWAKANPKNPAAAKLLAAMEAEAPVPPPVDTTPNEPVPQGMSTGALLRRMASGGASAIGDEVRSMLPDTGRGWGRAVGGIGVPLLGLAAAPATGGLSIPAAAALTGLGSFAGQGVGNIYDSITQQTATPSEMGMDALGDAAASAVAGTTGKYALAPMAQRVGLPGLARFLGGTTPGVRTQMSGKPTPFGGLSDEGFGALKGELSRNPGAMFGSPSLPGSKVALEAPTVGMSSAASGGSSLLNDLAAKTEAAAGNRAAAVQGKNVADTAEGMMQGTVKPLADAKGAFMDTLRGALNPRANPARKAADRAVAARSSQHANALRALEDAKRADWFSGVEGDAANAAAAEDVLGPTFGNAKRMLPPGTVPPSEPSILTGREGLPKVPREPVDIVRGAPAWLRGSQVGRPPLKPPGVPNSAETASRKALLAAMEAEDAKRGLASAVGVRDATPAKIPRGEAMVNRAYHEPDTFGELIGNDAVETAKGTMTSLGSTRKAANKAKGWGIQEMLKKGGAESPVPLADTLPSASADASIFRGLAKQTEALPKPPQDPHLFNSMRRFFTGPESTLLGMRGASPEAVALGQTGRLMGLEAERRGGALLPELGDEAGNAKWLRAMVQALRASGE